MCLGVASGQTASTPHRRSCLARPSTMTSHAKRGVWGVTVASLGADWEGEASQGMISGHPVCVCASQLLMEMISLEL